MSDRLKYARVAPEALRAMRALQEYVNATGLEHSLLELVKLRASYMNGCAYCADMHTKDARAAGETEQRLYMVPLWREAPFYTDRERAALAWTEVVTQLGHSGVPESTYQDALGQFSEKELVQLTMAVVAINGWNRLSVAFQTEVGSYRRLVKAS
jgi:AhpD family alkylhydroperoxidase